MTGTDEIKKSTTDETAKPAKFFLKRPGFWAFIGVSFAIFSVAVRWEQQYGQIIGSSVIGIAVFSFVVMLWLLRPTRKRTAHRHDTLLDALGQTTERNQKQLSVPLVEQLATIPQLVGEPGVDQDRPQPAIATGAVPEPFVHSAVKPDAVQTPEPVASDKTNAAHQNAAQVDDMLNNLPVGFFSADHDGLLLYINRTLARWLGVPSVDAIGRPFSDFVARASSEGELYLKSLMDRRLKSCLNNPKPMSKVDLIPVQLFCVMWCGPMSSDWVKIRLHPRPYQLHPMKESAKQQNTKP